MSNIIERAFLCPTVGEATHRIVTGLGLNEGPEIGLPGARLPSDERKWKRADTRERADIIGRWLLEEAMAAAERLERPVLMADPNDTVGTRD